MSNSEVSPAPVAVVTGANSGIGRATALHLAEHGYAVYGTVRSIDRAGKLLAEAEARGLTIELAELDIASGESVREGFEDILDRAGRIDHLINNAGVGGNGAGAIVAALLLEHLRENGGRKKRRQSAEQNVC